ncbi:hypothetical protein MKW94_030692 [Papaver nudicaule]|uniref:Ubiquitin-like protease family profile domain-containing protein n=1 Tax=Papaver nudicaule TaxID=74823 RepID=A0AA41V124_PAPNU|nr:hypothetical protein [Papaver nudicaule]
MTESRSGVPATVDEIERNQVEQGNEMVIRRKRSIEQSKQPESEVEQKHDDHKNMDAGKVYSRGCKLYQDKKEDQELEIRCFDQIRNHVGDHEMEIEGNMSPTPCEETGEFRIRSGIAQRALRIDDKLSAKKLCLENYHDAEENMKTDKELEGEDEGNMTSTPYEGKELASVSTMRATNNAGVGPASPSIMVAVNNNGNLGKGRASTSNRVQLNNNENLGNSPASSSSGSSNSNKHKSSTSDSIETGRWFNYEESLATIEVPSRTVSSFMEDSSVSVFEEFYTKVFEKFIVGGIPLITVQVDNAVFGTNMELHLVLDDVQSMCCMEDLSVNCVMAYIRHLHDCLVKRRIGAKFEFISPALLSFSKDGDFSDIITSRLEKSTCEWVLIPVNPEREGWRLVAIHMMTMSCYWLDPSGRQCQSNIRHLVTLGLISSQKDRERRKHPVWHIVKCPTQKSKVECGYYVLKFMREIVGKPNMLARSEPFPKHRYEQDEIDEVRLEWLQTVEACFKQ